MKTDRELLELAAKASGYASWDFLAGEDGNLMNVYKDDGAHDVWWPLEDDGDALRLAVKLNLTIGVEHEAQAVWFAGDSLEDLTEPLGDDPCAAMRRAIVRAAAAIGETMQ